MSIQNQRLHVRGITRDELRQYVQNLGGSCGQADRLFTAVHRQGISCLADANINRSLCDKLKDAFVFDALPTAVVTSVDGSERLLFKTQQHLSFEAVLIAKHNRQTICVSSQIGCALDCRFCLTAQLPFVRNLQTWEVVEQVRAANARHPDRPVTNIVFMGMGEPFMNFHNVLKAVQILTDDLGLGIARRRVTVSTVGISDKMNQWAELGRTHLAVSLTAADDDKRWMLMPSQRNKNLDELRRSMAHYVKVTKRKIFCEYILIEGVTDQQDDMAKLISLLSGLRVTLNLIPFNESPLLPYKQPSRSVVYAFRNALLTAGIFSTVRWSVGADIGAACGQLSADATQRDNDLIP